MESGRISERQLFFLMIMILSTTVVFFIPQIIARVLKQETWTSAAIATIWGMAVVWIITALGRMYPGLSLTGMIEQILGKWLGKALMFLYALWFLDVGAAIIHQFSIFLNINIMPETPLMAFSITMLGLAYYALRQGLEVWTRVNEILLPIVLIALIAVIVMPISHMEFSRLLPLGEHSFGEYIAESMVTGCWRAEIFIAAMLFPALVSFDKTRRNLMISVILIGVILIAAEIAIVAVFGGLPAGEAEFPFYALARMISFARTINRVEAILIIAWVAAVFIKICMFLYATSMATAETLGLKDFKSLFFPIGVLMLGLSDNGVENIVGLSDFMANTFPGYGLLTFEFTIPLILYIIALVRRRKQEKTS